jgi:hypothetical protein
VRRHFERGGVGVSDVEVGEEEGLVAAAQMGQAERAGGGEAGVVLVEALVGGGGEVIFRVHQAVVEVGVKGEVDTGWSRVWCWRG